MIAPEIRFTMYPQQEQVRVLLYMESIMVVETFRLTRLVEIIYMGYLPQELIQIAGIQDTMVYIKQTVITQLPIAITL